jgi:hypothetical protein
MNALLYNPEVLASYCGDATGRVVIFAFARASGIIMSRLLEAHAAYVPGASACARMCVCE